MDGDPDATRLPSTFWWLWGGALVSALATFVFPFLALYLTARGFDARQAGLLVSLLGAGALAAGPLSGTLADRLGRKPAILLALAGSALCATYLGIVRAPALIAPGIFCFGLMASAVRPAVYATVADVVAPAGRARAFGLLYWGSNLGIGLSAWVGGRLASKSWTLLFSLDAATTLLFAGVLLRRIPETRPAPPAHGPRPGWGSVLSDRALLLFLGAMLAFLVVFWQHQFALPLAMARDGLGAAAFGDVIALNCGFALAAQPLASRLVRRFDEPLLLAWAGLLVGAGFGAYALCHTAGQYGLATLLWTVGEVIGLPAATTLVSRLAPEALRGRYQGAYSFCVSAAMTIAPIVGGALLDRAGRRALWSSCVALGAVAAALHLLLRRGYLRARGNAALPA